MFEFLKKKKCTTSVGVQLSDDNLSIMVLDNSDSNPIIIHYMNCLINREGDVNPQLEEIKQTIEDSKLIQAETSLVLDDNDYQLLSIEAPPVTADEMPEAVKWKVKDLLSFPVDDAVIDVFLQSDGQVDGKFIANVVVVKKAIIKEKSQWIESLGLTITSIDIPELAYRNYIENSDFKEKNLALVVLKKGFGKLIVIKRDAVYFSRSFSVNYRGGLFDELPDTDIVLELQRSLDYYERQLKQAMPSDIFIVGENIVDEKITSTIKDNLNQSVSIVNVTQGGLSEYTFSEEESLSSCRLLATYGAALRHGTARMSP
ncbi:hypothetical protein ACVBE9_05775 [Eionea flava]